MPLEFVELNSVKGLEEAFFFEEATVLFEV